jgi:hypothetical protein
MKAVGTLKFLSFSLPRRHLFWVILSTVLAVHADPLDYWMSVSSGTTNHLRAVAFGGKAFVTVGDAGTVLTSGDGVVWTPAALGITNSFFGVAFGQGLFVCVGSSGTLLISTNGSEWSPRTSGTLNQLNAVASTPLGFVAAGNGGTILTSSDGSNWVARTPGTTATFVGVGFAFGRIFAGAEVNPPALFWSTNGSVWDYMTNVPPSQQPDLFNGGFAYGNGVLLGTRIRGLFARSLDGNNWTNIQSPFFYCFGLTFARDTFVTVGGDFNGGRRTIGTSTNGVNWQTRYFRTNEARLLGVAYGHHRFVTVGDNGSILVSAPLLWLAKPFARVDGFHLTLCGEAGGVYHIQQATDFSTLSWKEIRAVTNESDAVDLTLPPASVSPNAFYRVFAD